MIHEYRAWNRKLEIMVYSNEDNSRGTLDTSVGSKVELINFTLGCSDYVYMPYTNVEDADDKRIHLYDIVSTYKGYCVVWFKDGAYILVDLEGNDYPILSLEIYLAGNKFESPHLIA